MAESLSVAVVAVTEANGECWIAAVKQARIEAVKRARIEALHGARIALMHRTRSRPCSARASRHYALCAARDSSCVGCSTSRRVSSADRPATSPGTPTEGSTRNSGDMG